MNTLRCRPVLQGWQTNLEIRVRFKEQYICLNKPTENQHKQLDF